MADISIINKDNTDYNVKDAASRAALVEVENKGAKNILKTYDIPETTSGNVVFSIVNGVCSVSTTATQTTAKVLVYAMDTPVGNTTVDSRYTIPRGTYILKTTGNGKVKLRAIEHDGTNTNKLAETTGADAEFTYSGTMPYVAFTLSVSSNTSLSETVTFIPMCCLKAEYAIDQTAVRYGKTNPELTLLGQQDRDALVPVVNKGAKNDFDLENKIDSAVSYHANTTLSHGVLSVSATGNWARTAVPYLFKKGTSTFSCTVSNYTKAGGTIVIRFAENADSTNPLCDGVTITGNGNVSIDIVVNSDTNGYIIYYIDANSTSYVNSADFSNNMICTKAEWDISQEYVPYGMTNAELTAEMDYAVNTGVKNIAPVNSGSGTSVNLFNRSCFVSAGQYILSYKASDFSGNYELAFYDAADTYIPGGLNGSITANKSVEFRLRADAYRMRFSILGTAKITELMLRPAEITDPTFQPYALPNPVLTPALIEQVDGGAKNIANWTAPGQTTINNVQFVVENGIVTVSLTSGTTATDRSQLGLSVKFQDDLESGTYVLSGAPKVTAGGLYLWDNTVGARVTPTSDHGDGTVFTFNYDKTHIYNITVDVGKGYSIPSGTTLVYKPMICTKAAWDISHAFQPYRLPYQEISDTVQVLKKVHHYGFIIDKNNSDSYTAVSYTHGAVGFSPAYMDYTNNKFVYGSWADAWFIRDAVPVALNFDGTEAFELDKSDFAKKADGTASGIDCITMVLTDSQPSDWSTNWKWYYTKSGDYYVAITAASAPTWAENTYYKAVSALDVNFMLRMPKVYFKRSNDDDHNYIEISDRQLDSDFHAYAHVDANGSEKDYIYLPLFKGSMINGKLRSVPNVWPQNYTTAQQEIDAATALGTGWQIWDHSSRELINDLLILISKSLDCQTTFGRGRESGYVDNPNQNYGLLKTGSLTDKGMFYGYSSSTEEVKVFGMESFWANRWDRILGLILKDNVWKIKMQPSYNLTADGYTTHSVASVPSGNGYFKSVHSSEYGSVPEVGEGEASKYYRDYFYKNSSGTRVALVGGFCVAGAYDGFRYVYVSSVASASVWYLGASPVYK